jgi:succinate-acetate transporter protein
MDSLRANPAPLGLMGFGMTTVLLNLHNAGFFDEVDQLILAMGIFYGGVAQIIAGVMEYRRGNTFGTTAFTSYGLFWLSLVFIIVQDQSDPVFVGWYLALWGLFTTYMWVATLRKPVALQVVFASLAVLFFMLAIGDWFGWSGVTTAAGYEGIFCGMSAIYLAAAEVINETYGRTVLPVGLPAHLRESSPAVLERSDA